MCNNKGFTLSETLVSMLIFGFAGLVAIGGLMLGLRNYREVSKKSEAQVLLWQCSKELRSGFSSADTKYIEDTEENPAFGNMKYGQAGRYVSKTTDGSQGVLAFRPASVSVTDNGIVYTDTTGNDISCITTKDASNLKVDIRYLYSDGRFIATISILSGKTVVLSDEITVTPLNYIVKQQGKNNYD